MVILVAILTLLLPFWHISQDEAGLVTIILWLWMSLVAGATFVVLTFVVLLARQQPTNLSQP